MKKEILFILLIIGSIYMFSCAPKNIGANWSDSDSDSDTTGYYAARQLRGLGPFVIGTTTYDEAIRVLYEEIQVNEKYELKKHKYLVKDIENYFIRIYQDTCKRVYDSIGNIYNYNWVKYEEKKTNYRLGSRLIEFGHPDIKLITIKKYYIADLVMYKLILSFYNNILFKIEVNPSSDLENAFKTKYGQIRHYKNSGLFSSEDKYVWENEFARAVLYRKKDDDLLITNFNIETKDSVTLKGISKCINQANSALEYLTKRKKEDIIDGI